AEFSETCLHGVRLSPGHRNAKPAQRPGFRNTRGGYPVAVSTISNVTPTARARPRSKHRSGERAKALLLFFYSPTSGPSRRMDGLVSWLYVRERKHLKLHHVNVDARKDLAARFRVSKVPTLLLIKGADVVARLEGRVTGREI